MHVHKHNLESLHKKVPKRILPKHLGGEAGDIEDIASKKVFNSYSYLNTIKQKSDIMRERGQTIVLFLS